MDKLVSVFPPVNREPSGDGLGWNLFDRLFEQIDEAYCDDLQTLSSVTRDLARFYEVMVKFELICDDRNKKSNVIGIGLRAA